jgi:superfamily II DNA or RNA helicase/HKD family nuclease
MELKDIEFPSYRLYKSKTPWEPLGFFSDCLCNSTRFDLSLGFFSSSAIRILANGFAVFLYNGGTMRLLINKLLSKEDKRTIIRGINGDIYTEFDLSDISEIRNSLSSTDKHFFECVSWLIMHNRIEIKVISPKNNIGISHTKSGAFYDETNSVYFNGSCNFTKTAFVENIESINIDCEWDGNIAKERIAENARQFNETFNGKDTSVEYLPPSEIIDNFSNSFKTKDIEELLRDERELLGKSQSRKLSKSLQSSLNNAAEAIHNIIDKIELKKSLPHFPYDKPRDYQSKAYEKWRTNGKLGLLAMATGTGKTDTALNCVIKEYEESGEYRALILVPTTTLVDQWYYECTQNFNFSNVIKISSKENWKDSVKEISILNTLECQTSYIIISTYASFVKKHIYEELLSLQNDTIFIADECHNMGAPQMLKIIPKIKYRSRIGLSATPIRQYEDDSNLIINNFFGVKDEYTFVFTISEAIKKRFLCSYYYFPHVIELTDKELYDYSELSKKIAKRYSVSSDLKNDSILTMLLLERKRIIHKAHNKLDKFKEILIDELNKRGSLKYTIVYVPEGNFPSDYSEDFEFAKKDNYIEDLSDKSIINEYTSVVSNINNTVTVSQFTAKTPNRTDLIKDFSKGSTEVLISMKCLDEGVDIPQAELAIFCSSTGNPRQFIQRRGRILRKSPSTNKERATIHDIITFPKLEQNTDMYEIEKGLIKSELIRIRDFSKDAINSAKTYEILAPILNYYKINLYND